MDRNVHIRTAANMNGCGRKRLRNGSCRVGVTLTEVNEDDRKNFDIIGTTLHKELFEAACVNVSYLVNIHAGLFAFNK